MVQARREVVEEVAHRANAAGQRRPLVKQVAFERGMTPVELRRIVRVYVPRGKASEGDI